MKLLICILNLILFFNNLHSTTCYQHEKEICNIRGTACDCLIESHQLTGNSTGSIVVRAEDLAWDAVKNSYTYSEFAKTFQGTINYCNRNGKFLASNRLHKGFNDISDLFLDLYNNCILNHRNYRSVFERGKIHFDKGNIEDSLADMTNLLNAGVADDLLKDFKSSDVLIAAAQACLEIGEYEKAIQTLSDLIKKDPGNKEAYFHRAAAYFETGQFEEALKDYLLSDKGKSIPKSVLEASKEFTSALFKAVSQGAAEAAVDFVPSLCNSAYGLGEALWAITPLNPQSLQNINQFANACYEMAECTTDYLKKVDWQTVEGYVDQVKTLYERFDNLSESEKGSLIGYSIGRYGVDLYAGQTLVKGVSAYRKLSNANRMCTLETMATSNRNKEAIISSSLKHKTERELLFKNTPYNYDSHHKHIVGHNDYVLGKSIWDHPDPEGLFKKFKGTGRAGRGSPGVAGYKESVDFGEYIGIWKNKEGTIALPTTRGTIHYSNKGAHIVPSDPNPKF